MARYYFHVHDYAGVISDNEGQDLADLDKVRAEAHRSAWSILSEDVRQGYLELRGKIEVMDQEGRIVLTLPFDRSIEIRT